MGEVIRSKRRGGRKRCSDKKATDESDSTELNQTLGSDRLRFPVGADPHISEDAFGDLDGRVPEPAPGPALDLHRDRGAADLLDVAIASDLVADQHRAVKVHC